MAKKAKKKKTRRKIKITPQIKEQRDHRKLIRAVFRNVGFEKVLAVSDREFEYKGQRSDFDDVFVYENIIVLAEYTTSQSSGLSTHLKNKKIIYDLIQSNTDDFIHFFEDTFPRFRETRNSFYDADQCKLVILYCPRNSLNPDLKSKVPDIQYFEYSALRYFKSVSDSIRRSSRFEFLHFLGLGPEDVGKGVLSTSPQSWDFYQGSVLPESHSNYDPGYKVVSFYVDPDSLLERSYVLRRDGWRDDVGVYQRMISSAKIKSIRRYLNDHKRVFINNIVVTLPPSTKILDSNEDTINPRELKQTSPVTIGVPKGFNVIGIVDGQHRVFSYHEGGIHDDVIEKLRKKQNLLVTGIIYPSKEKAPEKTKFEANLFLEINSNQTSARSDLKQAIGLILNPYSSESIAKAVLNRLNNHGPLQDVFERHFYDKGKLKTSSIVSFALKPIVKTRGNDSFYSMWSKSGKKDLLTKSDDALLEEYITYCVNQLNTFMGAVKSTIPGRRWNTDRTDIDRVLSVVVINGLIICLRKIIENKKTGNFDYYQERLRNISRFKFSNYKSSQYSRMAEDMFKRYFEKD